MAPPPAGASPTGFIANVWVSPACPAGASLAWARSKSPLGWNVAQVMNATAVPLLRTIAVPVVTYLPSGTGRLSSRGSAKSVAASSASWKRENPLLGPVGPVAPVGPVGPVAPVGPVVGPSWFQTSSCSAGPQIAPASASIARS